MLERHLEHVHRFLKVRHGDRDHHHRDVFHFNQDFRGLFAPSMIAFRTGGSLSSAKVNKNIIFC